MAVCRSLGCANPAYDQKDFCAFCERQHELRQLNLVSAVAETVLANPTSTMAAKYPKYYKAIGELKEVDVYAVHRLFDIQDPSGAIQHASKKLLLSGVRTGGKSIQKDIQEARDTLTRWLELNPSA